MLHSQDLSQTLVSAEEVAAVGDLEMGGRHELAQAWFLSLLGLAKCLI